MTVAGCRAIALVLAVLWTGACAKKPLPPPPPPPAKPIAAVDPPPLTRGPDRPKLSLPPVIERFAGARGPTGASLSWKVNGADRVVIRPNLGDVPLEGTRPVEVREDTEYELVAYGPGGVVSAQVVIQAATRDLILSGPGENLVVLDNRPTPPGPSSPLDRALDALPDAGFLLEIPQLEPGRKSRGRLLIDPRAVFVKSRADAETAMAAAGRKSGRKTKVSEVMEAELTGPDGVRILPQGPARREISFRQPTEWLWEILPDTPGNLSLRVLLRGLVRIRGEEKMVDLPPFPMTANAAPATVSESRKSNPPASSSTASEPPAVEKAAAQAITGQAAASPAPAAPAREATGRPALPFALVALALVALALAAAAGWLVWRQRATRARTAGSFSPIPAPPRQEGAIASKASVLVIHAAAEREHALELCKSFAPEHDYLTAPSPGDDRAGREAFLTTLGQVDAVAVVVGGDGRLDPAIDWQIEKALQAHRHRSLPVAALLLNPEASIQRLRGLPPAASTLHLVRPQRRTLCFVSYSGANRDFVRQLAGDLEKESIPCWIDFDDLPGGVEWERRIAEAIESCTHVLFVLSAKALASQHVQDELAWARAKHKVLIPLMIEPGVEMPFGIHRMNGIDFTGAYAPALQRLAASIHGRRAASA